METEIRHRSRARVIFKKQVFVRLSMGPAWLFGNSVGAVTIPWLTARETAALIMVAVSLLFFRVFRERCLLAWAAGWVAYGAFLWVAGEVHAAPKSMAAFAPVDFVLAMGLFAAAALLSAQARQALTMLAAFSWVLMVFAAMRALYFPDSLYFVDSKTFGLDVACRLVAAGAVVGAAALPLRTHWAGALPVRRRAADVESALASVHQSYSE